MGRNKKLKNEIIENEYTNPQWKLIYFLCEDYGWDLVQIFGWLLSVGEIGILNSNLQKILNLSDKEFKSILTKIAKTGLIEKVRFLRQQNQVGIKLDWDEVLDKYGSFAREARVQSNNIVFQSEKDFRVSLPSEEFLTSVECNRQKKGPKRPTNNYYSPMEYLNIQFAGEWNDDEMLKIEQILDSIWVDENQLQDLEDGEIILENEDETEYKTEVGMKIATRGWARTHSLLPACARAETYTKIYYIIIYK